MKPLRLIKGLSLANLLLLPAWVEMAPGAGARYFMGYSVGALGLMALGMNLALLALLLNFGFRAIERIPAGRLSSLRSLALFLITGLALNGLRVSLQDQAYYFNLALQAAQLGWPRFLVFYGTPFLLLALFIFFQEHRFRRWSATFLLVLSPLPLVQLTSFLPRAHSIKALPPANGQGSRPKGLVLLFIFDEWDYNWTFPARPAHIALPELDRFARENLTFTRAYAPTSETFRSIPSLFAGKVVEAARTMEGQETLLKFRGEADWTAWSQARDLPYQWGEQGLRTCYITHYHAFGPAYRGARPTLEIRRKPYFQEWEEGQYRYRTFGGSLVRQWRCVLENIPGINYLWNHGGKVESVPLVYLHALDETLAAIHSRRFDAILVHWPVPHAPTLVDPATGEFTTHPPKNLPLTENLRLVDSTLRKVRQELEAQGLWKQATVVLTSDHWQRLAADGKRGVAPPEPGVEASQRRVPLLIKWPGATAPARLDEPVNAAGVARFLAAPEGSRNLQLLWETPGGPYGSYSAWIR